MGSGKPSTTELRVLHFSPPAVSAAADVDVGAVWWKARPGRAMDGRSATASSVGARRIQMLAKSRSRPYRARLRPVRRLRGSSAGIVLFALLLGPASLHAACVPPPTEGRRLLFRDVDGSTREAQYGREGTVRVVTRNAAGAETSDVIYADYGLRSVKAQSGGRIMTYVHEPDRTFEFRTSETTFTDSLLLDGKVLTKYDVSFKVEGRTSLGIGGCSYPVYKVVRLNQDLIGANTSANVAYFSKDFRLALKSNVLFKDGRKVDFEVVRIEAR